jgi:hypothetical protein
VPGKTISSARADVSRFANTVSRSLPTVAGPGQDVLDVVAGAERVTGALEDQEPALPVALHPIEANQVDHEAAGHWGVPTCAFRGEPFFGQDRLDVLLWRLKQSGLQAR